MRTTLLAAGALGLTLATTTALSATTGTFAGQTAGSLDLAAVSAPAYTLVQADQGAGWVDPATGEPPSGCRTGELRISARAGSLRFENITGHACSLAGHPGGSLTAAGAPAQPVLLAPGEHVQAAVRCKTPVRMGAHEVSAPGDTTTVPVELCAAGTVGPFQGASSS